jgi:hypothetical protein
MRLTEAVVVRASLSRAVTGLRHPQDFRYCAHFRGI